METYKIVKYLTRNKPQAEGGYMLMQRNDGQGVTVSEWFEPLLGVKPTVEEMLAVEEVAVAWADAQTYITYDELFNLIPRAARAKMAILRDTLKASGDAEQKMLGYNIDDIERGVSTGAIYNDGDPEQRAIFNTLREGFVTGGVLTQDQSDTWGMLEQVT